LVAIAVRLISGFLLLLMAFYAVAALPVSAETRQPATETASSAASPSPAPSKTPQPVIAFKERVVFTLGLSKDVATNTDVAVALAKKLKRNEDGKPRTNSATFVPEGTWGLDDFLEQCKEDPEHTMGAVIVLPSTFEIKNDNYLLMIRSTARVEFNTMVATCDPDTKKPSVDWVSDTSSGVYGRSIVQFLPLAVLTSVYLAFAPQRLVQTVATRAFPTPNPLPALGAQTSVQTTSQTTLNASGNASLQNSVVGAAGFAALEFGRQGPTEHYTVYAAEDAVADFMHQLKARCPSWGTALTAAVQATLPPPCAW
jgi:hypothetical protein